MVEEQMKRHKLSAMATSSTSLVILSTADLMQINANKNRPMCMLDPVVVDGIMRVGGCIDRSELSYEANHPVIFTAKSDPD